jgi:hypothetical protein
MYQYLDASSGRRNAHFYNICLTQILNVSISLSLGQRRQIRMVAMHINTIDLHYYLFNFDNGCIMLKKDLVITRNRKWTSPLSPLNSRSLQVECIIHARKPCYCDYTLFDETLANSFLNLSTKVKHKLM